MTTVSPNSLTRLDKLYYRVQAQHICLEWAMAAVADMPGAIFEIGLGHGRTYDHLRTHMPDRDIFVFDREIDCIADCTPPDDRLFLGDIGDTLRAAVPRFARSVALAHADMGTYDETRNREMTARLGALLQPLLAPGAIVLSDLPITIEGTDPVPLPPGARPGRYFLFRNRG
jgi:hypothetical protein